jgi:hypothetical protein
VNNISKKRKTGTSITDREAERLAGLITGKYDSDEVGETKLDARVARKYAKQLNETFRDKRSSTGSRSRSRSRSPEADAGRRRRRMR